MVKDTLKKFDAKLLRKDKKKIVVEVKKENLRGLSKALFEKGFYYSSGVGVDERPLNGTFAMYHIFNSEREGIHLVIKVSTTDLKIPSITPVIRGANWAEREASDMLGLIFEGHPEPERLILPDDWPDGVYPLRKEFDYNEVIKEKNPEEPAREEDESTMKVPMGPYHPLLHEPEYFEIHIKEEEIIKAIYRGFHVHRGMEKLAEGRLTLNQIPFLAERICGICGFTHSCAYCQAVENASGIDIPERAKYITTVLLEIERIHSHLLWIGVAFHLLGFDTGFMHLWRIREGVMDLAEILTGNRKTYGINLIGGVRRDIDERKRSEVIQTLSEVETELRKTLDEILSMKEIVKRIKGIGVLPKKIAREIGVVGPVARASGIDTDVRRDHPYAAYDKLSFNVPVYEDGDVLARFLVRCDETFESIKLVKSALEEMPKGDLILEDYEIPEGEIGIGVTEAPRGEDIHFVMTGVENKVYRWRPRASTYNNLPAVPIMLEGENIADAPIIIASIDPCFSCTDHVSVIRNGKKIWKGPLKEGLKIMRRR